MKKKLPRGRDARIARALRDKLNWSYTFRAEKGSKRKQTFAPRQSPSLSSRHFVDHSINEKATNSMCFSNFPWQQKLTWIGSYFFCFVLTWRMNVFRTKSTKRFFFFSGIQEISRTLSTCCIRISNPLKCISKLRVPLATQGETCFPANSEIPKRFMLAEVQLLRTIAACSISLARK